MATLGFIGTGNMGSALAKAACNVLPSDQIFLANRTPSKAQILAEELECRVTDNEAIAEYADLIFLGVKPQMMADLLDEIAPILKKRESRFILVSMAAGLTIARIQELAGGSYPVIRIMPNTPASIGEGMILYTCSDDITKTEEKVFLERYSQQLNIYRKAASSLLDIPQEKVECKLLALRCGKVITVPMA